MKYKLTEETKIIGGITLHRIEAIQDFASVKTGEKGGFIEKESNLSHDDDDDAWVFGDAKVYNQKQVIIYAIKNKTYFNYQGKDYEFPHKLDHQVLPVEKARELWEDLLVQ